MKSWYFTFFLNFYKKSICIIQRKIIRTYYKVLHTRGMQFLSWWVGALRYILSASPLLRRFHWACIVEFQFIVEYGTWWHSFIISEINRRTKTIKTIKSNKGNSEAMSKATLAILYHYMEQANHEYCLKNKNIWSSFYRDEFTGNNTHKSIKDPIPQYVVEIIKPLFERLGSPSFLAAIQNCRTQNVKESLHCLAWQ